MAVFFKILRFDPESDKRPRFQKYEVPVRKGMTLLEGLFYIQERVDGSIAFRASCRAGVCGSCGMLINDSFRLACETQIETLKRTEITLRPQPHLPIIKDLVVDLRPFWGKFKSVKPYLLARDQPPAKERPQSQAERVRINNVSDCILCANCYAACPISGTDDEYLGPQALLQANRFLADSRDGEGDMRMDIVEGENGVFRCHTAFACQKACPKDLDPSESIADIKRKITLRYLKRRR